MTMIVQMPDELTGGLDTLVRTTGRSRDDLLTEAVARYLHEEARYSALVDEGLREADEAPEEGTTHDEVVADMVARGMLRQEDLDGPDPIPLEDYRQAQQHGPS